MDKNKLSKIMGLAKTIEKKQGVGSIHTLGSDKVASVSKFSTYLESLDEILGGGIPKGRIIEISGPESSGKTSLAYYLCSLVEMSLFIPAEGTFDIERAKQFGNDPKRMLVYKDCTYAEDIINKVLDFAKEGIPLIVVDSVPAMVPKAQYDMVDKNAEQEGRRSQLASLLSRTLKNVNDVCERSGTTVIFINQVRDKMNAMAFGEQTSTPGGRALKHYCSVRIQVGRRKWLEVPNKNPKTTENNEKVGLVMKCKIIKSKVCNPFGECELPMLFEDGYVSHEDLPDIRKRIMKDNNEKYRR